MSIQDIPIEIVWYFVSNYRDVISLALTCKHFYVLLQDDKNISRLEEEYQDILNEKRLNIARVKYILKSKSRKLLLETIGRLNEGESIFAIHNSPLHKSLLLRGYVERGKFLTIIDIGIKSFEQMINYGESCVKVKDENEYESTIDAADYSPMLKLRERINCKTEIDMNCIFALITKQDIDDAQDDPYCSDGKDIYKAVTISVISNTNIAVNIKHYVDKYKEEMFDIIEYSDYEITTKPDIVLS